MRTYLIAMVIPSILIFSGGAYGETPEDKPVDVAVITGAVTGTLDSPDNKAAGVEAVGGLVMGVAAEFDTSPNWTSFIAPQIAIDAQTKNVLRKGVAAGVLYHLLGGSKKLDDELSIAKISRRRATSLSLLLQSAYQSYTARDPKGRIKPITGAVVENGVGIDFRKDLGATDSLGIQAIVSVLVMPASSEGLVTKTTQVNVYWRTYF